MLIKYFEKTVIKSKSKDYQSQKLDKSQQIEMNPEQMDEQISQLNQRMISKILSISKRKKVKKTPKAANCGLLEVFGILILVSLLLILYQYVYTSHSQSSQEESSRGKNKFPDHFSIRETVKQDAKASRDKGSQTESERIDNREILDHVETDKVNIGFKEPAEDNELISTQLQQMANDENTYFLINPELWTYRVEDPNYLQQLILKNQQRYASSSNFTLNTLSKDNYRKYLSQERAKQLDSIFQMLRERMTKDSGNLHAHIDSIERRLILLSVLYQQGGVIADSIVTLTQNFDWIRQIKSNIYVNRGNSGVQPRVVGFYSLYYSSQKQKLRKMQESMQEVERYMILIPSIEDYFIAAEKKAKFIGSLIDEIVYVLQNPTQVQKDASSYFRVDGKDIYYQFFMMACQRVLLKKQRQLDNSEKDFQTRNFAIDYYGLNLINSLYGPYKIQAFLKGVTIQKLIQNLAKWDLEEYEAAGGPMKYITNVVKQQELNNFLTRMKDRINTNQKGVMKGSFVQQMYFSQANESFIYQNLEKSFVNQSALSWSNLPKIIWLFWDNGFSNISKVPAEVYLCMQNLKKMAHLSGFQIREVNNSNLASYLDKDTLNKMDNVLKNAKMHVSYATKSDISRLALLYKYGGVYLDTATVAVQNFDWLVDIAKFPSKFIFNRFGEVPDVLLFWNQHYGGHFEWEVSETYNTKYEWRLSIFNGFMAAVKGSEYVKEWMDLFQELLMKPIEQVFQIFGNCGISHFQWINKKSHYLLAMDTGKCVLGRRQKLIQSLNQSQNQLKWKNTMDYYKLWTINSFYGYFKLRFNLPSHSNYDNLNNRRVNAFLTRFPQEYSEGIVGKVHFLFKIIGQQRPALKNYLMQNADKLLEETHSQSIFRKYYYSEKYNKFEVVNGNFVIKV